MRPIQTRPLSVAGGRINLLTRIAMAASLLNHRQWCPLCSTPAKRMADSLLGAARDPAVSNLRGVIALGRSRLATHDWCPECRKTARIVSLALEGASIAQLQEEQERLGISPQHEGP